VSLEQSPRFTAAAERWWNRRSRPAKLVCVLSALAIAMVASAAASFLVAKRMERADGQQASSERTWVTSEGSAAALRYLSSGLLDLKLTAFNVRLLDPEFRAYGGAIQPMDDGILIAELAGGFYKLTFEQPLAPRLQRLATHLELNAAAENEVYLATVKDRYPSNPVRVTDLLLLQGTEEIAVAHTFWNVADKCTTLRVSTLPLSKFLSVDRDASADWRLLFESKPCVNKVALSHESGGRMLQTDADSLLLTVGHLEADDLVRDPAADHGKLLRISLADGTAERVSTGHRNPQGLAMDQRGRLWLTEHGPQGGDELNLVRPGQDYGWPLVTFGTDYGKLSWPLSKHQGRHDGYQPPVFAWVPSVAASNLIVVANFHERWDGDLLVGSLRGESLFRLRLDGERVVYVEPLWIGERIRDIAQVADGAIWLWADSGRLIALSSSNASATFAAMIDSQPPAIAAMLGKCGACHAFDPGAEGTDRLTLWKVYDRRLGDGANKRLYSEAMLQAAKDGAVWDDARLDQFLANPKRALPGTNMEFAGVSDGETRKGIIRFLANLK
jgi:aldose sugar dehydrogenase